MHPVRPPTRLYVRPVRPVRLSCVPSMRHMRPSVRHMRPSVRHMRPSVRHMRPSVRHMRMSVRHMRPHAAVLTAKAGGQGIHAAAFPAKADG